MTYALGVSQAHWVRPAMAAGVAAVIALTLTLNNCWCDQPRWLFRLALVGLAGIAFAVELVSGSWPRWAFALSVAAPVGWLIFSDNGSVSALLLLLMAGWTVYTGSMRESVFAASASVIAILGYVHFDTPDRWLPWIAGTLATWLMMRLFVTQQALVEQLRAAQAEVDVTPRQQNAVALRVRSTMWRRTRSR